MNLIFSSRFFQSILATSVIIWEKKKRKWILVFLLSIQILQYEFLGPIPLGEWGPPMEKLVYLILSRDKDRYNLVYVGDCKKTDDSAFFVQHPGFKCWVQQAGSENTLHVAILPMFDSTDDRRRNVIERILSRYKPPCNEGETAPAKPDYAVRKKEEPSPEPQKVTCLCCGSEMNVEQILEKSTVFRCAGCGLSDTRLNS